MEKKKTQEKVRPAPIGTGRSPDVADLVSLSGYQFPSEVRKIGDMSVDKASEHQSTTKPHEVRKVNIIKGF